MIDSTSGADYSNASHVVVQGNNNNISSSKSVFTKVGYESTINKSKQLVM